MDPITAAQPLFHGDRVSRSEALRDRPPAPPWRRFQSSRAATPGQRYLAGPEEIQAVNAALCLRRPLLVTGRPGVGKSSLAAAVAYELDLGEVLVWPITSRSTLQHGLYSYDAIRRIEDANLQSQGAGAPPRIEDYLRLGPLGTALRASTEHRPRVLLIDEIDKSDIDLPNDLLHVFENGRFEIEELRRLAVDPESLPLSIPLHGEGTAEIVGGQVQCEAFPLVILTSNGEREFPAAFHRRCLRLDIKNPTLEALELIIGKHLGQTAMPADLITKLATEFIKLRDQEKLELSTDQLLNVAYLVAGGHLPELTASAKLKEFLLRPLAEFQE